MPSTSGSSLNARTRAITSACGVSADNAMCSYRMPAAAVSFGLAGATIASGSIYRETGPFVFAALLPLAVIGLGLALYGLKAMRGRPRASDQPQSAGEGG